MFKESLFNCYLKKDDNWIVFNSFTKSSALLDNRDYIKKCLEENNGNELKVLKENGFVVNSESDEFSILKYIYNKKFFDNRDLSLVLMPTLKCNFKCPYCFEKNINFIENEHYFSSIKKYIEKQIHHFDRLYIGIFGGEPLLFQNEILKFLKEIEEILNKNNKKLFTSIVTNGSLLSKEFIENLIRYNCQYCQITFDGSQEKHDKSRIYKTGEKSFDLLIKKMEMLAECSKLSDKFKPILRINVEDESCEEISQILNRINPVYRTRIYVLIRKIFNTNYYTTCNNGIKLYDYYDVAKKMGYKSFQNKNIFTSCEACGDLNNLQILPDLSVYKCVNDLNYDKAKIGRLKESGDLKLNIKNIVDWYNSANFFDNESCKKCNKAASCLGGCILYNSKTGKRNCSSIDHITSGYL